MKNSTRAMIQNNQIEMLEDVVNGQAYVNWLPDGNSFEVIYYNYPGAEYMFYYNKDTKRWYLN